MDINKLIEQASQQLAAWAQKEQQAHDQVAWWRGRLETLNEIAAATPVADQQAGEPALEGKE